MPLVVPALRLAMLFLNIYDSYKVLKLPPPSRRNGGQPSQRALSQRKRDMKGCLAVWIVWSCFITYERLVEVVVSLFIPFYDEFKSLGLLFLIFTRARGAEPIFLHVLRPLIKPYAPTLDLLVDLTCMIGDILFALTQLPVNYAQTWYRSSMFYTEEIEVLDTPADTRVPSIHGAHPALQIPGKETSDTLTRRSHQVWYPPPSSYTDKEGATANGIDGLPTIQIEANFISEEAKREHEEWRQYPAFPSAYPPTPLVAMSGLPPPAPLVFVSEEAKQAHEEWRQYPAFPSAYPPTPLPATVIGLPTSPRSAAPSTPILPAIPEDSAPQDFSESLQPPETPLSPGLSDDGAPRAQSNESNDGEDISMVVDPASEEDDDGDYEDDEEDAFNTTLQTPLHLGAILQIDRVPSNATSVQSRSTTLSTNGARSLRSSSSESISSAMSLSDLQSPPPAKKRPLPRDNTVKAKRTVRMVDTKATTRGRGMASMSVKAVFPKPIHDDDTGSKTSSSTELSSDQKATAPKRRKITSPTRPARVRTVRHGPVISRTQNTRTHIQTRPHAQKDLNGGKNDDNNTTSNAARARPIPSRPTRATIARSTRPAQTQGIKPAEAQ